MSQRNSSALAPASDFVALLAACAANLKKKSSQKRVFGVLSDLMSYCVFSFDGTTFLYHGALECRRGRKEYLEDMCASECDIPLFRPLSNS